MAGLIGYSFKKISSGGVASPEVNSSSVDDYRKDSSYVDDDTIEDDITISFEDVEDNKNREITNSMNYENAEPEKPWYEKLWDGVKSTGATIAVGATSIISGVADIGEAAFDGIAWAEGKVIEGGSWLVGETIGLVNEDAKDDIMEWREDYKTGINDLIATDWVDEANQAFYENTSLGQAINDASYMKYDSELAQNIEGISTTVGEIAIATGATILTGGAAAPFVCGTLVGIGNSAETMYQENPDSSLLTELIILGTGGLNGLAWAANGKLGASFVTEFGKSLGEIGFKDTFAKLAKDFTKPEFIKSWLKQSLTDAGNYISSAMMSASDLIGFLTGEKELNAENVAMVGLGFIKNFGLNTLEDGVRLSIGGFKAPSTEALINLQNNPAGMIELQNRVGQTINDELNRTKLAQTSTDISAILASEGISEKTYSDITQDVNRLAELMYTPIPDSDYALQQSIYQEIEDLNKRILNSGLTTSQLGKIISIDGQAGINRIFLNEDQIKLLTKFSEENPYFSDIIEKSIKEGTTTKTFLDFVLSDAIPDYDNYKSLYRGPGTSNDFWEELFKHITIESDGTITSNLPQMNQAQSRAFKNVLTGLSFDDSTAPLASTFLERVLNGELTDELEFSYLYTYLNAGADRLNDNSYTRMLDAISSSYQIGDSKYALKNMEYFAALNNIGYSLEPGQAYVQGRDILVLDSLVKSNGTAYHEFGHAIHHNLCESKMPDDIQGIIERARINAYNHADELIAFQRSNNQIYDDVMNYYGAEFEKMITNNYGSVKKYKQSILREIQSQMSQQDLTYLLTSNGISDDTTLQLVQNIDFKDKSLLNQMVDVIYNQRLSTYKETFTRVGSGSAFSDIISAIFQDNNVKINGNVVPLTFSHDADYFSRNGFENVFAELMANMNQLKMQNDTEAINQLRYIFGDELFDSIDEIFALADR